ncbi:P-loop containing nucleoside triphosphate hydrolase protein [Melampsora americana]|nr:P-loop containing nucleoside triphosphate hydrolase protein [Melampsora americana]
MPRHRGQVNFPLDSSTASTLVSTPTSPTQSNFQPVPFPSTSIDEDEEHIDPPLSRFPALGVILSFTTKFDYFLLLIPAVISSIISGLLPSYMTILIGEAFEAFTLYTLSSGELDSSSAKRTLRSSIGSVSLRLLLIGVGSCLLSLLNHALWSIYAARVCERLQTALYNALSSRPLSWFDNGMRTSQHHLLHSPPPDESSEPDSTTSSAAAGYSVTFLVNVILAFTKSYKLSLVILSTIPLIAVITAVISSRVAPFVALQNTLEAALSGELTRVLRTITLLLNLTRLARRLSQNYDRIVLLFSLRLGTTHSLALLMFVQGFGFGSHLISTGQVTPGDVNTVFWSSLIASSHMQMAIPLLGSRIFSYTKHPVLPPFRPLRKRIPTHFQGQLEFENVYFAYPNSSEGDSQCRTSQSNAPIPILKGVSMFFPAGDLTFVLGESGSGKSTVAVLALGLYSPDMGSVTADELGPISGLDPDWVRTECFFLGSFAAQFLLPGTIHENIALGACPRRPASSVSRDEVTRAARFALLHEFVSGLPNGYDTIVAGHDMVVSFQRLGLARAYLRDPTVLILDEPVSALDLVSQSLLAAAIRQWRHSKTTIWITHDLSPIEPDDFVYLLDAGHVIEADYLAGLRHRLAYSRKPCESPSCPTDWTLNDNTIGKLQEKESQTEEEYREIAMALIRVGQLASERREKGDNNLENDKRKSLWVRISCGVAVSIVAGVLTPVFSALLGQLLAKLADPPSGYIKRQSILIAVVAACLRIWLMEGVGTMWLEDMRGRGLRRVVLKDLTWFASPRNESSKLVNRFIKDGVEARELVSQILADLLTMVTLLVVAFGWAMVVGWELTLVGLSLAPIFFVVIGGGGKILGRLELENKRWRESVAMEFYLTMNQMKAIRVLSIDGRSVMGSKAAFIRASPFGGIPYGLNTALAYSAEALMFYVGSQWVVEGKYSFEKMTQVFSLIIFSVTFAGQMISYVPSISRSARAFIDLLDILEMSIESRELKGDLELNQIQGSIQFDHVFFSYPSPDLQEEKEEKYEEKDAKLHKVNLGLGLVPVLRSVSFSIRPGECVGIVGPSGSGKSTIAGLIQRFYEPDDGKILIDGYPLNELNVHRLREVIGVGTILENVAAERAAWAALEDVNLAGLVRARPEGLHSSRESRAIVVLDEPTAALDLLNQRIILKTIMRLKSEGKTVVLITHQMSVMRACDRLVVLQAGQVIETGSVDALMRDRPTGIFATLARGGEWGGG